MSFDWSDIDLIAERLSECYPDIDPLATRFTDLLEWILALDGFTGVREQCNEKKLEAVQMAWLREYRELQDDDE